MRNVLVASLAALCGLSGMDHTPTADEQRQERERRDRDTAMAKDQTVRTRPTAMDQGSSQSDIDTTARVRKALVDAENISTTGENVLVVTRDGVVSLVGDIDEAEHQRVLAVVRGVSGVTRVEDFINCCHKTGKPLYPAGDDRRTDARTPMMDQDREYDRRIREVWAGDEMVRDRVDDVRISRTEQAIHITGTVPDEATRRRVIESLEKHADGRRITDGLTIGASPAPGERSDSARGKQGNAGATDTRPVDPADAGRTGSPTREATPGDAGKTGSTR